MQEINLDDEADLDSGDDLNNSHLTVYFDQTCHMIDTPQILVAEDQPIGMKVLRDQFRQINLEDYTDFYFNGKDLMERAFEVLQFEVNMNKTIEKRG